MALLFQNFGAERCCLCGEATKLTGEHKIKASVLRSQFGTNELYIGSSEQSAGGKFVQGVGSKSFKFRSRLCEPCNTARTQGPDREFEAFNSEVQAMLAAGADPHGVFSLPKYSVGADAYLNVFRYFAKLLCCHIADISAPRPTRLSNLAIGKSKANYVRLSIQRDGMYDAIREEIGERSYAAHGGLTVYGDRRTGAPREFTSSLTIGPALYAFGIEIAWVENIELRVAYPKFYRWCRERVDAARQSADRLPT